MPALAFLKNTSGMFAHTGLNATVHSRQERWRYHMESFYIKCRALSARTATGEEGEGYGGAWRCDYSASRELSYMTKAPLNAAASRP